MNTILKYGFYLILILIVVSYWKGSQAVGGTLFGGVQAIINSLQGKNKDGNFSNYPQ
jgi:hypothetical protein